MHPSLRLALSRAATLVLLVALTLVVAMAPETAHAEEASSGPSCAHFTELRQPFFGTTHLHTGFSFDASIRFVPSTPDEAYEFARGRGTVPGVDQWGIQNREYKIDRPLDWGAVTDHAEYFGEIGTCKPELFGLNPDHPARYSLDCQLIKGLYWQSGDGIEAFPTPNGERDITVRIDDGTRTVPAFKRTLASNAFTILTGPTLAPGSKNTRLPVCESREPGVHKENEGGPCAHAAMSVWQSIQDSANQHYDECNFTTFVAYEAASTPSGTNWHRNVIFRNENVIDRPITAIDMADVTNPDPKTVPPEWFRAPAVERLWHGLKKECRDAEPVDGKKCDVFTIPHNSNLGGGVGGTRVVDGVEEDIEVVPPLFFNPRGKTQKAQAADAQERQNWEPLVEIFQDKGSSECRFDPRFDAGVGTSDELCSFEILDTTSLSGASGVGAGGGSGGVPPSAFNPRAFVRNVLKDGLKYQQELGVNPFKLGIVAASDSHNGTMGWHPENATYGGHEGIEDAIPVTTGNNIQNNSGGHTVVWAEQNTRDSIFDAMQRRETYGTSGTRPTVRFFGGWGDAFESANCDRANQLAQTGYLEGVPMGGDLESASSYESEAKPTFLFSAWKDDFINTDLQRVQIIKGWLDDDGNTQEMVVDVAGGPNDAWVDRNTCEPVGAGAEQLCGTWTDQSFEPDQAAFYYLRVLENPVCRYSTHICRETYGVDPLSTDCSNQLLALRNDPQTAILALQAAQCCNNETTDYFVQPVIQERAWTSPIWFTPSAAQ